MGRGSFNRVITVLLVDDHALVRRGFRKLLEDEPDIQVIGEAGNGRDAVSLACELKPNVVVMDYAMPELDGVQATNEIRRQMPGSIVLMLSMHADDNYRRNAMRAGASGYALKTAIDVDLAEAIRQVASGRKYGLAIEKTLEEPEEELTPREKQILQLIAQGNSNKDIASLLNLSVNTVSVHRNNLMHKMRVHRTAELVLYAIRKGLVSPP
ncbi:MAG: response regulator transcription factor [Bryobacteraceae bacterium]|nr:response regulator transcription factor [Bryobacteraceae bacterium]